MNYKARVLRQFISVIVMVLLLTTNINAQYRTKILNKYEYKQKFPAYQEGSYYQPKPKYSYKNKYRKK